ncbi:MAG: undecaprenyl-diphosphatase UppP [Actinobacteria bacterium]|nr:undecaprenyl-diphosphatase UppP [Actinomycetota bacterium]
MTVFEALILGLIQGITEFLPISSSAHVQIAQELMGISNLTKPQLTAFIATIQIGTEIAVLIYFAKTIWEILGSWFQNALKPFPKQPNESRLGWLVILGSIPVAALGLLFQDQVESDVRQLWVIGVALIVFGIALGLADHFGKREKTIQDLDLKSGLAFGFGQALALIPGVSRSGGTITVGRMLGFTREAAARYSFLLAIPAVLASGIYQFLKSYQDLPQDLLFGTAIATVVSGVSGYLVIAWLLKYLTRGSFLPFVIWRVGVGSLLLIGLSIGAI